MSATEYQELLEDMRKLLAKIKADPPDAHPFVITLPGTYKAFLNIH
jgi:hypothetical protein